jgi:hypothetical protein
MTPEQKIFYGNLANIAVKNFGKRHINAQYVSTKEEAIPHVLNMVPGGAIVGTGESVTLNQIGVFPALRKRGLNEVIYPFERDNDGSLAVGWEEANEMMRKVLIADVFISGTNAITLDGKVVNVDGYGNRVAPMIFGPKKVIIIVGANKIVKDSDEAINRIREICAPMNALRHGIQHHDTEFLELPCAKAGVCVDCYKPQRMCNFTTIIEGESHDTSGRINIIIIGEQLGF